MKAISRCSQGTDIHKKDIRQKILDITQYYSYLYTVTFALYLKEVAIYSLPYGHSIYHHSLNGIEHLCGRYYTPEVSNIIEA